MNTTQIYEAVEKLATNLNHGSFIYDFLLAYNIPKSTISRLKNGGLNLSKSEGEVLLKRKLFFREEKDNLLSTIDDLKKEKRIISQQPRFIVVTDYRTFLAFDTKTRESLYINISELHKYFDFFLPWAGIEKSQAQIENLLDRKAAEKMAKLYDEIKRDNYLDSKNKTHSLNVFLSRLLFCFFAEDTGIFPENLFKNFIEQHTGEDGPDLKEKLQKLFSILNTQEDKRGSLPEYLNRFPFVNGGLFKDSIDIPEFNKKSRKAFIENCNLDWSQINPDIFGSMIQAVVHPAERGSLGMHYTSVANIMKVIGSLFLDELKSEYSRYCQLNEDTVSDATQSEKNAHINKLKKLLSRITRIKFLDPACGSGNFLIIAYKELRKLEMDIIKTIHELSLDQSLTLPSVSLNSFFGIEIEDFASEIAKLSLWLAQHQMNLEYTYLIKKTESNLHLHGQHTHYSI